MKQIALIFGGANSEHEVSVASARGVLGALDPERYDVNLFGIDRAGGWHRLWSIDDLATVSTPGTSLPDLSGMDVAFPVLHGRFGEDGTLQGLLELEGVPYVGCGVLASALAMDKRLTASILQASGLPAVGGLALSRHRYNEGFDLPVLPVFVNPNRAGSSVGAHLVSERGELDSAIRDAFGQDEIVLLQPVQTGIEVDVGILQGADGYLTAGAPLLVRPGASSTFFDYAAKYTAGGAEFEVPAQLPASVLDHLVHTAKEVFTALQCDGLARIDFFVNADGSAVVNEVNTLPGMSARSQFPRMFEAAGLPLARVVDTLIARAEARSH